MAGELGRQCRDKGKRKEMDTGDGAGGSSSGVAACDRTAESPTFVVTKIGNRVQLNGGIDKPWTHGQKWKRQGFKCGYCTLSRESGGVTRLRDHLAGLPRDVVPCENVPRIVKEAMLRVAAGSKRKKMDAKENRLFVDRAIMEEAYEVARRANVPGDEEGQIRMAMRESLRDIGMLGVGDNSPHFSRASGSSPLVGSARASGSSPSFGNGRASGSSPCFGKTSQTTLGRYYSSPRNTPFDTDLARSMAPMQPRIDVMLQGGNKEKFWKTMAKWFHANDIAGRKADCPYFRAAIRLAQQLGDLPIPSGRDIDGSLLDMNYEDLQAEMDLFKEDWRQYGVTLMCDSWTGPTMMCIINFMVFCNGRMFFHKTVNATGHVQNAEYIYQCIREVLVEEIGADYVVQIVTDNGSNYKKACQQIINEFRHITWQPCAAHTINLMLKDISRFDEVVDIVDSAKRICRFFYNHNRLHATMREKIGGELIRWNATRFGTVFLFLQSFWDKQDKFQAWMVSNEWKNSEWKKEDDYYFTYDCLINREWWDKMELVLKAVTPIYSVLRFADQQKKGTISGFLPKMLSARGDIRATLKHDELDRNNLRGRVAEVISRRTKYLLNDTLMLAAAALDPTSLYKSKLSQHHTSQFAVTVAIKKLAKSPSEAAAAIDQFMMFFCTQKGLFGTQEARFSALNGNTTPAAWWSSYGGQCVELQKIAKKIVSQCMSSSGCERNWSTFALVHTKVRNRLSYEKLHKLVFVHYNLKLAIQQHEADFQILRDRDIDPCAMMVDVAFYDEDNPIMEWLSNSMSESAPTLDEYDDDDFDWNSPSSFVIEQLEMNAAEVAQFKKKLCFGREGRKKKGKAALDEDEEDFADDYESDSPQGSPAYAESEDSSSADEVDGDDVFGDGSGGFGAPGDDGAGGSGSHGGAAGGSGAQAHESAPLRPRSTRQRKPTMLKSVYQL